MDNRPKVNMQNVVHIDPGHAIMTCVSREINGEFKSAFLLYLAMCADQSEYVISSQP